MFLRYLYVFTVRFKRCVGCAPWSAGADQRFLALALLVARVFADHHDPAVAADHFALIADRLNAWLNLHDFL